STSSPSAHGSWSLPTTASCSAKTDSSVMDQSPTTRSSRFRSWRGAFGNASERCRSEVAEQLELALEVVVARAAVRSDRGGDLALARTRHCGAQAGQRRVRGRSRIEWMLLERIGGQVVQLLVFAARKELPTSVHRARLRRDETGKRSVVQAQFLHLPSGGFVVGHAW